MKNRVLELIIKMALEIDKYKKAYEREKEENRELKEVLLSKKVVLYG